jgi:hypothetical protein
VSFRDALLAVKALRDDGVVSDYAIGGAMALVFWTEPVATYDLDVFVLLPPAAGPLVSLGPIYAWASRRGYAVEKEHILVSGIPVQVIPAHNALAEEAVREAVPLAFEDLDVRVVRREHLIALYLEPSARTRKRMERVAALVEEADIDRVRLDSILSRHGLVLPGEMS